MFMSRVTTGQFEHATDQRSFIIPMTALITLAAAWLIDHGMSNASSKLLKVLTVTPGWPAVSLRDTPQT